MGRGGGGGGMIAPAWCKNACPSGVTTTMVPKFADCAGGGGAGLLGMGGDVPLYIVRRSLQLFSWRRIAISDWGLFQYHKSGQYSCNSQPGKHSISKLSRKNRGRSGREGSLLWTYSNQDELPDLLQSWIQGCGPPISTLVQQSLEHPSLGPPPFHVACEALRSWH